MNAPTTRQAGHPVAWWAQFQQVSERFDAATAAEGLTDEIVPKIPSPLLRREADLAADVVLRHLRKPANEELAARAQQAAERLAATVERLDERSIGDAGTTEAYAVCHVLAGRYAEAAAAAEPFVGIQPLIKAFLRAMRLERFDSNLTVRLLNAGQHPAMAVRSGLAVGKYGWWPSWLLKIVTERALAGTLDEETITALDQCAYAELTPAQARVARRLLGGDQDLIEATAHRMETLGMPAAAAKLREGNLTAVAVAARQVPV